MQDGVEFDNHSTVCDNLTSSLDARNSGVSLIDGCLRSSSAKLGEGYEHCCAKRLTAPWQLV